MPIDTSSYYPEVPSPDGRGDDEFSLNKREGGLFGDQALSSPESSELKPETECFVQHKNNRNKDDDEPPAEKVVTGVSHFLSWLLVPLLMPVYGLILAFGLSILDVAPMGMRVVFTLIVAGINVLIPMIQQTKGEIDSIHHFNSMFWSYSLVYACQGCTPMAFSFLRRRRHCRLDKSYYKL